MSNGPSNNPRRPPARGTSSSADPIAGSVLPIESAEGVIANLPGVLSARVLTERGGQISEIHVLATPTVSAKRVAQNVATALLTQLGLRVDHRKISVATTASPSPGPDETPADVATSRWRVESVEMSEDSGERVTCRVALRVGARTLRGDGQVERADGTDAALARAEASGRAAVHALRTAEEVGSQLTFIGVKLFEAFGRRFVIAGVSAAWEGDAVVLAGSAEVRDRVETAAVHAILDATNRWLARPGA